MDYFAVNSWQILNWPAYSTDLNPIGNLYAISKKRFRKQTVSWENSEENILEIWNYIDQEFVSKLYESMES